MDLVKRKWISQPFARRRGFSFVEVLFAVMILGVGFIMIAAIFPASLTQTRATTEEANAAAIARSSVNYIERAANEITMEPTNDVVVASTYDPTNNGSLYNALRESMVLPSDTRYSWIVFYRRYGDLSHPIDFPPDNYAQVIMVPMSARNTSNYVLPPGVTSNVNGTASATATITDGGGSNPDSIQLSNDGGAAVSGAYVVIASCSSSQLNGHILRLGRQLTASSYELAPGNDYQPEQPSPVSTVSGASVFIVGRGTDGAGPAQDVAVYTTYVQVR